MVEEPRRPETGPPIFLSPLRIPARGHSENRAADSRGILPHLGNYGEGHIAGNRGACRIKNTAQLGNGPVGGQ